MAELPVAGASRPERADAARNRRRVLDAARQLFAERGVRAVTMSDVAEAAGVAKGTIFHRFGDRAGLATALVDEAERGLQEQILRGPPPLGPGAAARERLDAFLGALAALTAEHYELLAEIDSAAPAARYRTGAYRAWLQHVVLLLGGARRGRRPGAARPRGARPAGRRPRLASARGRGRGRRGAGRRTAGGGPVSDVAVVGAGIVGLSAAYALGSGAHR